LLRSMRRQVTDLPGHLGLVEGAGGSCGRGGIWKPGQKVLLVLDQFEQWLHAKRNEENTELVQAPAALRRGAGCSASSWCGMISGWPSARFMQALEIRVVEGENSRLVDLFDPRHARKVLTAFGRAFGALLEKELTKDQEAFLDQAVAGLAQDGKVISVRLALFAENGQGQAVDPPPASTKVGGNRRGRSHLFSTRHSPPRPPRRRIGCTRKAAQAALKALLPENRDRHQRSHAVAAGVAGSVGVCPSSTGF